MCYIGLARSISQGHAYLSEWAPGAPAHQRFPPGFPILLAPAQWLAPHNYALCRLVVVGFSGLAMYLLASYTGWIGIPILVGLNSFWLTNSSSVLSEQPFLAALLLYLGAVERPQTRRRSFFLGLGLGLLCMLRTVAIALIPATFVYHWKQKKGFHGLSFLIAVACSAGPLLGRSLLTGYDGELDKSRDLIQNVWVNLQVLPGRLGWMLLLNADQRGGLPDWLGLIPLGAAALGLWKLRRESSAPAWVLCCFTMLLAWPYPFTRLLLPLVPFMHLGLWRILGRRLWLWLPLALLNLGLSAWQVSHNPARQSDPGVVRAIRQLPPASAISSSEMLWWLQTDVPCLAVDPAQALGKEWDWLDGLRRDQVRLVVLYRKGRPEEQRIVDSFQRRPWFYRLVYSCPQAVVYSFQPPVEWKASYIEQQRARQSLKMQRPDKAVAMFQKALRAAPYDFSAATGLAYALTATGELEAAGTLLQQVLAADPDCGEAILVSRFLEGR